MTKRTLAIVAVVVVAMAELALVSSIGHAHHVADSRQAELDQANQAIAGVEATVAEERQGLVRAQRQVTARGNEAELAREAHAESARLLAKASHNLDAANTTLASIAASLAALNQCVTESKKATFLHNAGNSGSAIDTLRTVQPVCESLATPGDPEAAVFPFDFSDPSVLVTEDGYYAYSTNSPLGTLPVISSTDLVHWTIVGNALPWLPTWAVPGATWAPSVVALGFGYVAYYTVRRASDQQQCISVAVSDSPEGPFLDRSTQPLVCGPAGSIDPQVFVDGRGQLTLLWKGERAGTIPATIWSAPLRADGLALANWPTALIRADEPWEGGVVEAPSLVYANGQYALFYSGNNWNSADYALGEARCASPSGPCSKPRKEPVFASHGNVAGPGSATAFVSRGRQLWLVYNAFHAAHVGYPSSRLLHIARVSVDDDTVKVTAP